MTVPSCLLAAVLAGAPLSHSADDSLVPHAALADEFLQRHGFDPAADPAELPLEQLLEEAFLHARFGVLDLAMDAKLVADAKAARELLDMAVSAVKLQMRWIDLATVSDKGSKEALKDGTAILEWLAAASPEALAASCGGKAGDLAACLPAKDAVKEAIARFDAYMLAGTAIGLAREDARRETLLLAPKRRDFHELLGVFGWMSPDLQEVYWHDGTIVWTNTYYNDITVVALQYHTGDTSAAAIYHGIDANERNPTAKEQQVTQLAANALITNLYGDRVPPSLVGAMAINLVVDVFGECATRVDGDLRQRRTEAREVFIPGGQSEGGMLPPNFANSRFRGEEGKDRFLVALKSCQSAGSTQAKMERKKGKIEHFQLWDDSQAKRYLISAPMLGTPAASQPPLPPEFHADGAEFFRAYRTCFLHWLATEGAGSKKKSDESYAALLRRIGELESAADIEAAVVEVYGMPLSSKDTGKDDLEGRFLTWMSKQ